MKSLFLLSTFALILLLSGCAHSSPELFAVTAFKTPVTPNPLDSGFDPLAAPSEMTLVDATRPQLERGTTMKTVRELIGPPNEILHRGTVWVYWNYRSDAAGREADTADALVMIFDREDQVAELKLVNSAVLRAAFAKGRALDSVVARKN